jgi:hypothetical protein
LEKLFSTFSHALAQINEHGSNKSSFRMRGMFQIKTFCVEAAEYNDVYTLVNEQSLVCAADTLKAHWQQKRSNNTTLVC